LEGGSTVTYAIWAVGELGAFEGNKGRRSGGESKEEAITKVFRWDTLRRDFSLIASRFFFSFVFSLQLSFV